MEWHMLAYHLWKGSITVYYISTYKSTFTVLQLCFTSFRRYTYARGKAGLSSLWYRLLFMQVYLLYAGHRRVIIDFNVMYR